MLAERNHPVYMVRHHDKGVGFNITVMGSYFQPLIVCCSPNWRQLCFAMDHIAKETGSILSTQCYKIPRCRSVVPTEAPPGFNSILVSIQRHGFFLDVASNVSTPTVSSVSNHLSVPTRCGRCPRANIRWARAQSARVRAGNVMLAVSPQHLSILA